jgi:hypothetical protein
LGCGLTGCQLLEFLTRLAFDPNGRSRSPQQLQVAAVILI